MHVDLLGPLRVLRDGTAVEIRGGRLRTLLVELALRGGRAVPADVLVDAVWGQDPPGDAANALQSLVSRLRAALGDPATVQQVGAGYRLAVEREDVDALRFERLVRDPAGAREALALWRGEPAPEVGPEQSLRLGQLRRDALVARLGADLLTGLDVRAELEELVAGHPLDEGYAGLLLTALAQEGRQAEALRAYERIRRALAEELGADPSAELQERHLAVLRAQPAPSRHNLRAALTPFIGRDDELAGVADRLAAHRLVTLIGAGGSGKTRLATEAAACDQDADRTWFVELAPVSDPDDVARTVLSTIGLRESALLDRRAAPREVVELLLDALGGQGVLLVLDNAEHLIDAVAELADLLLARTPDLRILVTSREPLGIAGEALLPVTPLAVPPVGATPVQALAHAAVALFRDRAAAVLPGFVVDERTVADVVEVVRRLDGLPLALELAAARLRTVPLDELVAGLGDRFRLLTGGSRTALPRHRTLRAVVAWSWDLLTGPERRLADRASVFPAGLTTESAAAVVDADEAPELLAALVDKSLLQRTRSGRYRMLETLREYGAERLVAAGQLETARRAHAAWFAGFATRADAQLRGPDQLRWFALLREERENLLAALAVLLDADEVDAATALALDLGWYTLVTGQHAEAVAMLDAVLAHPSGADADGRLAAEVVRTLHALTGSSEDLTGDQGRLARVQALARRLLEVDLSGRATTQLMVPVVLYFAQLTQECKRLLDASVAGGDAWSRAAALHFRARFAENQGDLEAVRRDVFPALDTFRTLGERWGLASMLPLAAQLRQYDGDLLGAVALLEEAAERISELGSNDQDDEVFVGLRLVDLHLRLGDDARARELLESARGRSPEARPPEAAMMLDSLSASYLRLLGDREAAHASQDAADRLLRTVVHHEVLMPHGVALVNAGGAGLALADGDLEGARRRLVAAHAAAVTSRDLPIAAVVGVTVASLHLHEGHPRDAAEVLGASARLRGDDDATALDVIAVRNGACAQLGPEAYEAAYATGRALSPAAALARTDPC